MRCSAPPVARWTASKDADDEYDDYDAPSVAGPSVSAQMPQGQHASLPPPGTLTGSRDPATLPHAESSKIQETSALDNKVRAEELPVLGMCDNGETILHFSEVFAPPRHVLER